MKNMSEYIMTCMFKMILFVVKTHLYITVFTLKVMGQTQTALLAISTALDEGNHYSALTKLEDKETGEPLFNVIRVGQVCEACAKTTTPWLCNHKAYDIPPWKSAKKQKRFSYIYEGQQYRNLRENFGVIAGSGRQAFKNDLLDKFKNALPITITRKPTVVFIGADPGGGGPSDLALTGMIKKDGIWVIMALVATTVRAGASEEKQVILSTFEAIKKTPEYSDAIIVFIPENAPAISASHLQSYVMNDPRVCTMAETSNRRPGVRKTMNTTRDMQYIFESLLATGCVRYAKKIITFRSTQEEMKTKLEGQMKNFRWDEIPSTGEFSDQKFKLHGKAAGENDDLLISCLMVPYWAQVWFSSDYPDYQPFKYYEEHGYFKEYAPIRYNAESSRYVQPSMGY